MIVTCTKLQRKISAVGLDDTMKLAVNTSGSLKRLNVSAREADSVINRCGVLKAELDKVPSHELDAVAIEVDPHVARLWVTVLQAYVRKVTRIEKSAGQVEMQTMANTVEDAAEKLNAQLHEQMDLPIATLESVVRSDDETDAEFGKNLSPAPHRGPRPKADLGLAPGAGQPADPRSRRGPKPASDGGKKWDRTHQRKGGKGSSAQVELGEGVQAHRDGPANVGDVAPIAPE